MLETRSEGLEMLEVKENRWFGRLNDGSPKVKWMRRVYPRVDYTQAPWTAVRLRQSSQSIHTHFEGGIDVSPAVPNSIPGTSFCGLHSLLATQQNQWYHHLQREFDST